MYGMMSVVAKSFILKFCVSSRGQKAKIDFGKKLKGQRKNARKNIITEKPLKWG